VDDGDTPLKIELIAELFSTGMHAHRVLKKIARIVCS
jgi:hypothetical protein